LIQQWIRDGARIEAGQSSVPLHTLIATAHPRPPEAYSRPVPIRALAFNANGSELAIGGYHEITFWRAEDGKLLRRIPNIAQQVYAIAYAPDGKSVAVASGIPGKLGQINILDPTGTNAGRMLGTARDAMFTVCFNTSGDRLAAGGADNAIRVFNVETGKQELLIEQHADWVLGLSFNYDTSLLASASRDKTARVFNTTNGELESTYVGHSDAVFAVAFATDGKRVCSAGRDKALHLWEAKEAKKSDDAEGFEEEVLRMVMGTNAVFTCNDTKIRQHLVSRKLELVRAFSGHEDVVYAIALHEPTARLASGSFDGQVRIWDLESGKTVFSFTAAPGLKPVRSVQAN
jgi:WD40 repeat protein